MDDRLGREDLTDRRRHGRRPCLLANHGELLEDVVEPVARAVRSEPRVDRRDKARRQLVLRGSDGDVRGERRNRVVADELVDDLRRLPERLDVDAGVHPGARERAGEPFA